MTFLVFCPQLRVRSHGHMVQPHTAAREIPEPPFGVSPEFPGTNPPAVHRIQIKQSSDANQSSTTPNTHTQNVLSIASNHERQTSVHLLSPSFGLRVKPS